MGSFPERYNDPTPGYVTSDGCTVERLAKRSDGVFGRKLEREREREREKERAATKVSRK